MTARSDSAEYVRTLVTGDFDANRRYERRLDEQGWVDFPQFLSVIFYLAVERRFQPDDRKQVIQFVADLRTEAPEALPADPLAIVSLISAVLDPAVEFDIDQEDIGKIQMFVAHKILREAGLSDQELDSILAEADDIASRNR